MCLVTPPFIQLYRPGILQVQCTLSTQVQGPSLPLVLVSPWHPPRFAEGPIWLTSVPTALCTIWPSSNLQPGFKWHTWETFHIGCYHLGCSILGVAHLIKCTLSAPYGHHWISLNRLLLEANEFTMPHIASITSITGILVLLLVITLTSRTGIHSLAEWLVGRGWHCRGATYPHFATWGWSWWSWSTPTSSSWSWSCGYYDNVDHWELGWSLIQTALSALPQALYHKGHFKPNFATCDNHDRHREDKAPYIHMRSIHEDLFFD